jgi:hypothetical protein
LAGNFGAVSGEKAGFKEEMRESDIFTVNKILEDLWDPAMTLLVFKKFRIIC